MSPKFESLCLQLQEKAKEIGLHPEVVPLEFAMEMVKELCDELSNPIEKNAVKEAMSYYLSTDPGRYDEVIEALEKAMEENPTQSLDFLEFGTKGETVSVWEPLEGRYCVEEFCELINL
jgi:putative sterol carrier protein